ncbi:hypothetical protein BC826DRAFT_253209 [Russula brevipes]|nr:hypothetical protein BC826DRAFT_253209 [Russula brevipes]
MRYSHTLMLPWKRHHVEVGRLDVSINQPDPGIATVSVLAQSLQQLAGLSLSTAPMSAPFDPNVVTGVPLSPSASAIWVNALWFASLVTSLTCTLFATLLQHGPAESAGSAAILHTHAPTSGRSSQKERTDSDSACRP